MEFQEYYNEYNNVRNLNKSVRSDKDQVKILSAMTKARNRGNFILRQELSDFTPECSIKFSIICNSILMLTFGICSISILISSNNSIELNFTYDNCKIFDYNDEITNKIIKRCVIDFNLPEILSEPIFFYYNLRNFYSNYREYVKSKVWSQLRGENTKTDQANSRCKNMEFNYELFGNDTSKLISVGGFPLISNEKLSPCGLIAGSFFNDTFKLYKVDNNKNLHQININETDIAYKIDRDRGFKRQQDYLYSQWIDVENEHFMVWMNMETLQDFYKYWGRIEVDLPKGDYQVHIDYNWESVGRGVSKSFSLSSSGILGSASFFGWSLVTGTALLLCSVTYLLYIQSSQKIKFEEKDLIW